MKKISTIPTRNKNIVIYFDEKREYNKFCMYYQWYAPGKYGCHEHKKLIDRYGDFTSCIYKLIEMNATDGYKLFNLDNRYNN